MAVAGTQGDWPVVPETIHIEAFSYVDKDSTAMNLLRDIPACITAGHDNNLKQN